MHCMTFLSKLKKQKANLQQGHFQFSNQDQNKAEEFHCRDLVALCITLTAFGE